MIFSFEIIPYNKVNYTDRIFKFVQYTILLSVISIKTIVKVFHSFTYLLGVNFNFEPKFFEVSFFHLVFTHSKTVFIISKHSTVLCTANIFNEKR